MAKHLTFLFLYVSFTLTLFIPTTKAHTNCSTQHFPTFLTKSQNDSGLELRCQNDTTVINFPSYGHGLTVKSISYDTKTLDLVDPERCVYEVFLNLNLSLTSFRYFHVVERYTYINCSTKLEHGFEEIPCMSARERHVYTIKPSMEVPSSCHVVKTVAIPFEYSPYLDDDSFGLALTWGSLQTGNGGFGVKLVQVFAVGIFIFAVASAFSTINATLHNYSKNPVFEKKDLRTNHQAEDERFVGVYRTVSSFDDHEAHYVDQVTLDLDT